MNFQQLKYALTLAQEKSFTKASEKLYITHYKNLINAKPKWNNLTNWVVI